MNRTLIYGTNTVVAIVLFTAILLLVNIIPHEMKAINVFGTRIPLQKQWDLTENKKFTLTDQTSKVLARLDKPESGKPTAITAIGFAQRGSAGYTDLEDMLKQYAFESPNFTYRIEDPVHNPTIAQKYGIKSMRTLILEYKDAKGAEQKQTVTLPVAQGAADYQQMESKITAGLMRIINPKTSTIYFTRGHGEAEIDDANPQIGLSTFKTSLEGENYVVKGFFLYNDKKVPDDASVVVIAGVGKDFFPEEVKALQAYLARGGRVLCFYPSSPMTMKNLPNLDAFFQAQGIAPQNDLVISGQILPLNSKERILAPAVNKYGASPITERFSSATAYPLARSFKIDKPPKDATVTPLATTVAESWEIRHPLTNQSLLVLVETEQPTQIFKDGTDTKGEAILAVTGKYNAVPADLELPAADTPSINGAPSAAPSGMLASGAPSTGASGSPAVVPAGAASGSPAATASGQPASAASASPVTAASGQPTSPASGAPAAGSSGAPDGAASPLAGASPSASPAEKPKTEARIVVFGSAQMIMGGFFSLLGNGDIVMNSVAWLAERTEQIAINRPEVKKQPLTLDETAKVRIDRFAMPILPCLVGLLGMFVLTLARKR